MTTVPLVYTEAELYPWYFKPLTSGGRWFRIAGTYISQPLQLTVKYYEDKDNLLGIKADKPSTSVTGVSPSSILPAELLEEVLPSYPKTITRGSFSFVVDTEVEERVVNDILGISPTAYSLEELMQVLSVSEEATWYEDARGKASSVDVPGLLNALALLHLTFLEEREAAKPVAEAAPAGATILSGLLKDPTTGLPVSGAVIEYAGHKTTTDAVGNWQLTLAEGVSSTLRVAVAGYSLFEQALQTVTGQKHIVTASLAKALGNQTSIVESPAVKYDLANYMTQSYPEFFRMLEPGSPKERIALENRARSFQNFALKNVQGELEKFHESHSPVSPEDSVAPVLGVAGAAAGVWGLSMAASTLAEATGLGQIESVSDWLKEGFVQFGLGAAMGVPIADTYDVALRRPYRSWLQKEFRTSIPGISDQVRFTVREAWARARIDWLKSLDPAALVEEQKEIATLSSPFYQELKRNGAYLGYTDELLEAYWHAHWVLPSTQQLFEMRHRDLIDDATLRRMLTTNDIHPAWIDRLQKIAFEVPRLVDIRTGFEFGAMDEAGFRVNLTKRGYDPADIEWIVQAGKNTILRDDFNRVRTQLIGLYVDGYITEKKLEEELRGFGLQEDVLALNMREAVLKQVGKRWDAYVRVFLERYSKGVDNEQEAHANLSAVIIQPNEVDYRMEVARLDPNFKVKKEKES